MISQRRYAGNHSEVGILCLGFRRNHSEVGILCPRFRTRHCIPCNIVPEISGRPLQGRNMMPRISERQFQGRNIVSQIQDRPLHTMQYCAWDFRQTIARSEFYALDLGQYIAWCAMASLRFESDKCRCQGRNGRISTIVERRGKREGKSFGLYFIAFLELFGLSFVKNGFLFALYKIIFLSLQRD